MTDGRLPRARRLLIEELASDVFKRRRYRLFGMSLPGSPSPAKSVSVNTVDNDLLKSSLIIVPS